MTIHKLVPNAILDTDNESEVIYFVECTPDDVYYTKNKYFDTDFKGSPIQNTGDYIRTKSVWYGDIKTNSSIEIIPYGQFDINDFYLAGDFLYFVKIIDKDNDGILTNDYDTGEIWRVRLDGSAAEYCFDLGHYRHHGFLACDEKFIVFESEDNIPDTTELVVLDLEKKRHFEIHILHGDENTFDYRVVKNSQGGPAYLIAKRWVSEGGKSSKDNMLGIYEWSSMLDQLNWKPF
jgi:hypothetical protein